METVSDRPAKKQRTSPVENKTGSKVHSPQPSRQATRSSSRRSSSSTTSSHGYVPNSNPLPLITRVPLDFNPKYGKCSILSRETTEYGKIFYRVDVKTSSGKTIKKVRPEDILHYASPLELEKFETIMAREEAERRDAEGLQKRGSGQQPGKKGSSTEFPTNLITREDLVASTRLRHREKSTTSSSATSTSSKMRKKQTKRKQNKKKPNTDKEFEVEAILADDVVLTPGGSGLKKLFLVKWKGFPDSQRTWEPWENLSGASDLLTAYLQAQNKQNSENRELDNDGDDDVIKVEDD